MTLNEIFKSIKGELIKSISLQDRFILSKMSKPIPDEPEIIQGALYTSTGKPLYTSNGKAIGLTRSNNQVQALRTADNQVLYTYDGQAVNTIK